MLLLSISSYSATYYSIASGDWNVASIWSLSSGGSPASVAPISLDDAIITTGTTVNLTASRNIRNVTINGTGSLNFITPSTLLTLSGNFTMNNISAITGSGTDRGINLSGNFFVSPTANVTIANVKLSVTGTFNIGTSATVTLNTGSTASKSFGHFINNGTWNNTSNNVPITISGNFENNGTFNNGTGKVTFTGATSNTVSGTAPLTTFDTIVVNKGTSGTVADQNNVLDVQSLISLGIGKLFLQKGTFKLSSASTIVPFSSATNRIIAASARLWNNGGTINSTADFADWLVDGTLQNSAGTMNVGVAANQNILTSVLAPSGVIVISGGAVNVAGTLAASGTNNWTYTMSGGTLSLRTFAGNTYAPFSMKTANSTFTMTDGRIIIMNATITNLGFINVATLGGGFTGGTLQIGTATTPVATGNIRIETTRPIYNLEVVGANTKALITSPIGVLPATTSLTITNDVTITSGILDIATNNQDVFVGGNWKNTSTAADPFIEGTKKVTFNGVSGTQTISNSGAVNGTTFYDLTINNTSLTVPQVKTTANVAVKNTLTMIQGKVHLSGTTLTLGTGPASVASIGSLAFPPYSNSTQPLTWIYGGTFKRWFRTTALPIRNIAGLFPFGSETDYHPLWFNYSAAPLTTGGTFSVTHAPSGPGSVAIPNYSDASCGLTIEGISNASWVLSTNVVPTGNTLGISYGGFGFANFLNTDLNASNALGTAGNCIIPSNVNPGIYFEVNRSALSLTEINNAWYIGTANLIQSPLPIELLSFDANSNQQVVDLNWSTASETNSDYYTIEKTRDGYNFETVVTMDAAGNSNALLHYATKDNSPYQGISYYRLKQTDFNGAFTYSDLQMVDFNSSTDFDLTIFSNPNNGTIINLSITSTMGEEEVISIFDFTGKECYSKIIVPKESGKNEYSISPSTQLASGVYLIVASSQNKLCAKKMIVK